MTQPQPNQCDFDAVPLPYSTDCTRAFTKFQALSVAAFGATCIECGKKFECKCPKCAGGQCGRNVIAPEVSQ